MFEVTYSLDGLIKKVTVSANDSVTAQQVFTNMYGSGSIQIINIRRI